MNKAFRVLTLSVFTLIMLFQFQNCGSPSVPATGSGSQASSVACSEEDCITPNEGNLSIKPNLASGQVDVTAAVAEFNVGGDCNEGSYPANVIHWELRLNGAKVRDSSMAVANGGPADTLCVNGRFLIYVNLAAVTGDAVNRTGLLVNSSSRGPYDLVIQIYGQNTVGGAVVSNTMNGRTVVPLVPR